MLLQFAFLILHISTQSSVLCLNSFNNSITIEDHIDGDSEYFGDFFLSHHVFDHARSTIVIKYPNRKQIHPLNTVLRALHNLQTPIILLQNFDSLMKLDSDKIQNVNLFYFSEIARHLSRAVVKKFKKIKANIFIVYHNIQSILGQNQERIGLNIFMERFDIPFNVITFVRTFKEQIHLDNLLYEPCENMLKNISMLQVPPGHQKTTLNVMVRKLEPYTSTDDVSEGIEILLTKTVERALNIRFIYHQMESHPNFNKSTKDFSTIFEDRYISIYSKC